MTYNRSDIMNSAWVIVRRFQGNGEPLAVLLSRALQSAWGAAKMKASVARASMQAAQEREALAARPVVELQAEIITLENKTRLDHAGQLRLSQLRAAIRAAKPAHVAEVAEVAEVAGPKLQNVKTALPRFVPASRSFNPAITGRPTQGGSCFPTP